MAVRAALADVADELVEVAPLNVGQRVGDRVQFGVLGRVGADGRAGASSVSYTKPTSNPLQDATLGLGAPGFTDEVVQDSVGIEAEYDTIGAGLDNLEFTLTRGGSAGALDVTVTLTQDEDWLVAGDLIHTVSFVDGSAETTLTIGAGKFSFTPSASGDVTATVSGTGVIGGEDTVEVISTAEPPITLTYDKTSYTFAEDAAASDVVINLVATLDAAYPRGPTSSFYISTSTVPGTADSPEDYFAFGVQGEFSETDFTRTVDTDPWVATRPLEDRNGPFRLRDDDVDEDDETLAVNIQATGGFHVGLVQLIKADNSTCLIGSFCEGEWPVTITDDDDAPVLGLTGSASSIDEEDDDTTMDVAENAVTLTVASTNGKISEDDQTLTLTFGGSATYGTDYQVTPADADTTAAGHQVALPGEPALIQAIKDDGLEVIDGLPLVAPTVELTVTAAANDSDDGDRAIQVTGARDGTAFGATVTVTIVDDDATTANALPMLDNAIPDRTATAGTAFTYTFAADTFSDADGGDTLTYTAARSNGAALPFWLSFTGSSRTFSGTPGDADVGTISVQVTASDSKATAQDTFDIEVRASTAKTVAADWSLKPDGVAAGGTFRLLFVSSTTRDATSTDIADYNTHVQTAAAAGHTDIRRYSADFTAFGSTATVNARDNTRTTDSDTDAPIYWLHASATRAAVADNYADFYDGTWDDSTGRNENGSVESVSTNSNSVYTGTDANGTTHSSWPLGGSQFARTWYVSSGNVTTGANSTSGEKRLFGLSPIFKVATTTTTGNATGKPTVSGTAAVGEALSASTSGISDTDGKTKADNGDAGYAYTYQWFRVDADGASNKTLISSATAASYTPVAADVGKKLIVEVSFVDDGDVSEGPLASDPYPSSGTVTATTSNTAPTLDNAIPDRTATAGTGFSYTFPSNTFNDADGDALSYTAARPNDSALPDWLTFTPSNRTFSGTPGDVGTVSVKVTASDGTDSVSDTFDIRVRANTSGPLELTVRMLDDEITEGEPVRYRIEMSRRTGWVEVNSEYAYRGRFMETEPVSTRGDVRSSGDLLYWEVERDTVDDGTAEDDGSFTVKLRPGDGYTLGTPSSATVRILDNDEPVPVHAEVSVTDAEVEEGPGAELGFAVTLDNALSTTATVDWETLDGAGSRAALAGQDYEGGSGTLTFRPGQTRKTVRVRVYDDNDEQSESMVLLLSNPSGVDMSGDSSFGVGRILARAMISVKDVEAQEATNAKLTFTVALDRARDVPVTVDYTTVDGTATAGADYRAKSGTLTFRPGDRWELVLVDIRDDSHNEGVETMKLRLSNPSGARFSGGAATLDATGRIRNTDPMPAAWIARLGRAASDNVIEAVSGRWQRGGARQQTHFTFGGRRMDGLWAGLRDT
ncbi:MAG: putative Ig domain-containing protein, partial [Chloroflexi bacterium]|nr:putative Ig domain-containing protein [Chloroflexota bacterium]